MQILFATLNRIRLPFDCKIMIYLAISSVGFGACDVFCENISDSTVPKRLHKRFYNSSYKELK